MRTFVCLLLFLIGFNLEAQKPLINYYYPKDSLAFKKEIGEEYNDNYYYPKDIYGKTTMIIHAEYPTGGQYDFVFKKKIIKTEHFEGETPQESYTVSEHNLYAFVLLHDHGGYIEKAKFQEFGNVVYWPEFDYQNCSVSDEDKDGSPEFYLSYTGSSDGLDAQPYKQIIYMHPKKSKDNFFIKAKATAWTPSGNPEDVYYEEFDANWKNLPKAIQNKSKKILKIAKQKNIQKN